MHTWRGRLCQHTCQRDSPARIPCLCEWVLQLTPSRAQCVHAAVHVWLQSACMHSCAHPAAFNMNVHGCAHLTALHSVCTPKHAHTAAFSVHTQPPHILYACTLAVWRVLSTSAELRVAHTAPAFPPISCTLLPALICLPAARTHLQGSHWRGQATSQGDHRVPAAHGTGASLPALAQAHSRLASAAMQRGAWGADPLTAPPPPSLPSLDVGKGWATLSLCHVPLQS